MPTNSKSKVLEQINNKFKIFNVEVNQNQIKFALKENLSGTIVLDTHFKTCLMTDITMFDKCIEINKIVYQNALGSFKIDNNFKQSNGENGFIDIRLILDNINIIFDILILIGFELK